MNGKNPRLMYTAIVVLCIYLLVSLSFILRMIQYTPPSPSQGIAFVVANRLSPNTTWRSSLPLELPANDSSRLVNTTNFKFLMNPSCTEHLYVVCVHSAPGNHVKRRIIRQTWGAHASIYFFFGTTSLDLQTKLDEESRKFHDIVQGNFNDSYRNTTLKHTMVFKWIVYHCPNVRYVLKCDDDVFVNIEKLNHFITHSLSPHGTRNLLMCSRIFYDLQVQRSYRTKWRVSFKEYPGNGGANHNAHCRGYAVLYSPDIIFKLYQLLQREQKYLWVDDTYITGILFGRLNLMLADFEWWPENENTFFVLYTLDDAYTFDPHKHMFALIGDSHNRKMEEMFRYMSRVTFDRTNSTLSSTGK